MSGYARSHRTPHGGFTLMEMLIAIAILAALTVLLIPIGKKAIAKSHQARAMSNMRQIYTGLAGYHGDQGRFPSLIEVDENGVWGTAAWHHDVAEYLGYDREEMRGGKEPPKVFRDPATKKVSWRGAYGVFYNEQHGPIRRSRSESLQTLIKPASTPLLGTAQQWVSGEAYGSWYVPNIAPFAGQTLELSDRHEGGAILVFADGHSEWMLREKAYEQYFPWRNE